MAEQLPTSSQPVPSAVGPRGRLAVSPDALFAYGTLQFPGILSALLRRVPEHAPGTVTGWRVAALAARTYPGIVPASQATATGILVTGLTPGEWRLIDTYEDDSYELRQLTLSDEEFGREAKQAESATFVAHVRWATAGGRTAQNTHPFAMHGRIMAHNGGFRRGDSRAAGPPDPGPRAKSEHRHVKVVNYPTHPMSGSRGSGCGTRPDAARTQAMSSARSAGRPGTYRRAISSSRIAAVIASPAAVAMLSRPSASVRSSPCTTASTTRLGTNSPSRISA